MTELGNLLDLTLSGHQPTRKAQLTADGTHLLWRGEGALEITPASGRDNGHDLLLSAGLHGNETAPIELLDRLIQKIASGQLRPSARVLFLFGNPEAMRLNVRYVEQDINRLFFGRYEGSSASEALRASELERIAAAFFVDEGRERLHYDLHTAIRGSKIEQFALYPWSEGREHSRTQLTRLRYAGINTVLLQNKTGITFSSYTYSRLGAEAFTLELGKARPFGQNLAINVGRFEALLESLIEGKEALATEDAGLNGLQLFVVSREVIKLSDEFRLHLDNAVENFTELKHGYLLAEDIDGIRWIVEERDARILFPNPLVSNGLRACILVVPTSSEHLV